MLIPARPLMASSVKKRSLLLLMLMYLHCTLRLLYINIWTTMDGVINQHSEARLRYFTQASLGAPYPAAGSLH